MHLPKSLFQFAGILFLFSFLFGSCAKDERYELSASDLEFMVYESGEVFEMYNPKLNDTTGYAAGSIERGTYSYKPFLSSKEEVFEEAKLYFTMVGNSCNGFIYATATKSEKSTIEVAFEDCVNNFSEVFTNKSDYGDLRLNDKVYSNCFRFSTPVYELLFSKEVGILAINEISSGNAEYVFVEQ